jgi:hypothetical protein
MKTHVKIPRSLLREISNDLERPHPFACERVAFVSFRPANLIDGILLLANDLHVIRDEDYERDESVGAMLGSGAFRMALQYAYNNRVSMFHVHRHEHYGRPFDSAVDLKSSSRFVPDFWKVRPDFPHGTILLSMNCLSGLVWTPKTRCPVPISRFTLVGVPTMEVYYDERAIQATEFSGAGQ